MGTSVCKPSSSNIDLGDSPDTSRSPCGKISFVVGATNATMREADYPATKDRVSFAL